MRERRREPRMAAEGDVNLILREPGSRQIRGRLLDASRHGFRVAHDCAWLSAGQQVRFVLRRSRERGLRGAAADTARRSGAPPPRVPVRARGTARVVWTRIVRAQIQSGLWIESG